MLGKDHILISLAWALLLLSPILLQYPEYALAFFIGITIGAVYPDIDSSYNPYLGRLKKKSSEGNGPLTWIIALLAYPVKHLTGFIFSGGNKAKKTEYLKHRNLIHSIAGILVSLLLILIPLNIILYLLGYLNLFILLASAGVLTGAFMHLMEDSCTLSGVKFFYPASKKVQLHGNIRVSTGSGTAGFIFTILFAAPAAAYLIYEWLTVNNPGYLSQYSIPENLAFLDGINPWIKTGVAAGVSLLIWLLCFGISRAKAWDSGNKGTGGNRGNRGNGRSKGSGGYGYNGYGRNTGYYKR